jgi:hypothetical protein
MPVELQETNEGKIVEVKATGKLTSEDYGHFVPEVERLLKLHGHIRLLFEMRDFHGWAAGAMWQDLKFGVKHFRDIERLAMVGDKKWEKGMAIFCKPFTTAQIRYFDTAQLDEARSWLETDQPST